MLQHAGTIGQGEGLGGCLAAFFYRFDLVTETRRRDSHVSTQASAITTRVWLSSSSHGFERPSCSAVVWGSCSRCGSGGCWC
jgi:hypothetical protein